MEDEIIFNIDVMLAKRKMSVTELADRVGITLANMSILKNGKAKAVKISTLLKLCQATASPETCWNTGKIRNSEFGIRNCKTSILDGTFCAAQTFFWQRGKASLALRMTNPE